MTGAMVEVAVLLMHLAMWGTWELIATQPPSDRLIGAIPGLVAFVAIYATADNLAQRRSTRWRRGPLIAVVMVTAVLSALGGGRDGLALSALRARGLVIQHPMVVRSVPAPREGPLPSRTTPPVRVTLGVLVVLATALSRAAR